MPFFVLILVVLKKFQLK